MEKKQLEKNHIRIGYNTRVGNVIRYVNALIKEDKNVRSLNFTAIGGAIGTLVNAVEVIKIVNPGYYQVNKISSVAHKSVDTSSNSETIERLSPKLDVTLTLDKPSNTSDLGYQDKLDETKRLELFNKLNESLERRRGRREQGNTRGRGGRGGQNRGRGFTRGRGGNRGRGENRGRGGNRNQGGNFRPRGFSGGRGQQRGPMRGGRGGRGNTRGGNFGRGGQRGGFRPMQQRGRGAPVRGF